ncbi:MAG: hypothetical protein ABIV48_13805 [Pyrinomonadaceae bacterium]
MISEKISGRFLGIFGFAVFLLVPSFDTLLKYFGTPGLAVYFIVGTGLIIIGYRYVITPFHSLVSERQAIYLAIFTFVFLTVITAYVYPIANSGRFGGGTDIDDAMIIGASEIIQGHYPYYRQTYLGGWISPMPGTILLSVPFVFINLLPYQNIFWLLLFFIAVRANLKSNVYALGLLWTILLFSPTFYQVLVTGSDHISNTLYVLIGMWFMVRSISDRGSSLWQRLWPTVLFGIGLSSRSNFLLLVPLLISVLAQNSDRKLAFKYVALAGLVFSSVTLPFWLYDPGAFTPLVVQSYKIQVLEGVLPYARIIIPGSAFILSLVFSCTRMEKDCAVLFRNSAIVQLFVLLFSSILFALQTGQLTLFMGTSGYGMFTLFFGLLSTWIILRRKTRSSENNSSRELSTA